MAEGDSIHRQARRLHRQLVGRRVEASDFRLPQYATMDLAGVSIDEVAPVGKHFLVRMSDDDGQRLTLHMAPRMSGRFQVLPGGHVPKSAEDEVRLVLRLDDGSAAVAFDMPVLDVLPTGQENTVVGHLGPDLCGDEFDMAEALRRFAREGDRPIIESLLDQRNVCGIGNVWAVEVCFLRGIYPWAPTDGVDVEAALRLARKMMRYSLLSEPGMITTGNKRKGETHWVYGRYNRPCRRCRTPVAFRPGGKSSWDRETWWCPHCQPNPDPKGAVPPPAYRSAAASVPLPKQRGSC